MGSRVESPSGSSAPGDGDARSGHASTRTAGPSLDPPNEQTVVSQGQPLPAPAAVASRSGPLQLSSLLEGERLDHFQIERYVGGGGMGAVFRARDTLLDRTVAVKVLPGEQADDAETLARFRNEGQSAAHLDHDNIARVFHVGEDRGLHYIVFEYVEGVNIRDLIAQHGQLSVEEAVSYTLQIAEALAHASSRDIVHRDVKPSNVLILEDGRVKLVDMGLARQYRMGKSDEDLTASGVTLGTFDYISPEQARDPRSADVRSDIYSLGCTIYYMLTARPPFPEGTVLQKLLQHQGDEPPDPREFNPAVPDEIAAIVGKMLAKDPDERYQNPAELVGELLLAAQHLGLRGPGTGGVVWVSPGENTAGWLERNVPWVAPVAALICIVLILDFFVWAPDNLPPDTLAQPVASNPPAVDAPNPPPAVHQPGDSNDQTNAVDGTVTHTPRPADAAGGPPAAIGASPAHREAGLTASVGAVDPARVSAGNNDSTPSPTVRSAVAAAAGIVGQREASTLAADTQATASLAGGKAAPRQPATGDESETPLTPDPPSTAALEPGLLIVDSSASGPQQFRTLEAAASMAKDGDTIELRYSGRRTERPIALGNRHITIRAGNGYQPVVVFRPGSQDADSWQRARSMISVVGGELTLFGLSIELDLPKDASGADWSLLEIQNTQRVALEKCTLTVRNAADAETSYHRDVTFFNVTAPPGQNSIIMPEEMIPDVPDTIELNHCVIRGEAVVLRSSDQRPVTFTWNNGLLATTEQLLELDGLPMPPRGESDVRVRLNHLTAEVLGGLCGLSDESGPFLATAYIRCENSIVQVPARAAMIDQSLSSLGGDLIQWVNWNGHHNVYAAEQLWRQSRHNGAAGGPIVWDFAAWTAKWDNRDYRSIEGPVAWQLAPPVDKRMHARTPADYLLLADIDIYNPAIHFASDHRDAGMIVDQLPRLPTPFTASRSSD